MLFSSQVKKGKKKKNKKRKSKRKKTVNDVDVDETAEHIKEGFQQYWNKHGETLVWEAWIEKYPQCATEQNNGEEQNADQLSSQSVIDDEQKDSEIFQEPSMSLIPKEEVTSPAEILDNMLNKVKDLSLQPSENEISTGDTSQSHLGENEPEMTPEDYEEHWKNLWNVHYDDCYWYHYSQYQEMYVEETVESFKDDVVSDSDLGEAQLPLEEKEESYSENQNEQLVQEYKTSQRNETVDYKDDIILKECLKLDEKEKTCEEKEVIDVDQEVSIDLDKETESVVKAKSCDEEPVDGSGDTRPRQRGKH